MIRSSLETEMRIYALSLMLVCAGCHENADMSDGTVFDSFETFRISGQIVDTKHNVILTHAEFEVFDWKSSVSPEPEIPANIVCGFRPDKTFWINIWEGEERFQSEDDPLGTFCIVVVAEGYQTETIELRVDDGKIEDGKLTYDVGKIEMKEVVEPE